MSFFSSFEGILGDLMRLFFFILSAVISIDAWGYIDPGSGSFIFQILLAGMFAAIFTLKTWLGLLKSWIKTIFGFRRRNKEELVNNAREDAEFKKNLKKQNH